MNIQNEEELRSLYGFARGRAKIKQLDALERHSVNFIERSPFMVISTVGVNGNLDCSPRGGKPGFIRIIDEQTIVVPDSKGNNRLDSLVNIIETGNVGCLFLIPGVDETLRLNGRASLSTRADYLGLFAEERNPPKCVIEIEVRELFLHCAKALMRSELWLDSSRIERKSFPTMGKMLKDQLNDDAAPESQEAMLKRYTENL